MQINVLACQLSATLAEQTFMIDRILLGRVVSSYFDLLSSRTGDLW